MFAKVIRPWHHAVDIALFMGGWSASLHADAGGTMTAGVLLMVMGTASFIGNEYGLVIEKKKELEYLTDLDRTQEVRSAAVFERTNHTPEIKPKLNLFQRGQNVYNQIMSAPKIDHERGMANTLVAMRDGGFKMDISESYWIRDGHWKDTPQTFRATRAKWEHYQIVGKRGTASNSRYEIQNERAVELIAQGRVRLPSPNSM